jgi:hypothetical protein
MIRPRVNDWETQLLRHVRRSLAESLWSDEGGAAPAGARPHLVVLVEPYLSGLLNGVKTVESRFSRYRRPPYRSVSAGDALILKRSAGPVVAVCRVTETHFHEIGPGTLDQIRGDFGGELGIPAGDRTFWRDRAGMKYATLLRIADVRPLPPIPCAKRDQRAWVVLRPATAPAAS